jgi:hypothetical protein
LSDDRSLACARRASNDEPFHIYIVLCYCFFVQRIKVPRTYSLCSIFVWA